MNFTQAFNKLINYKAVKRSGSNHYLTMLPGIIYIYSINPNNIFNPAQSYSITSEDYNATDWVDYS